MPPIYDFTQETFDHSLLKWVLKTLEIVLKVFICLEILAWMN